MSRLPRVRVSDEEKLEALQRLDQHRRWRSLDEKRYCLGCGKLISGGEIELLGGSRPSGPLRLACPTDGCPSIPMDWVMPTTEVLKATAMKANETPAAPSPNKRISDTAPVSIRARMRKFARHARLSAQVAIFIP
ncbi:MAG: hypothetical protein ABJB69_10670 [Spartobacteria bacterium]